MKTRRALILLAGLLCAEAHAQDGGFRIPLGEDAAPTKPPAAKKSGQRKPKTKAKAAKSQPAKAQGEAPAAQAPQEAPKAIAQPTKTQPEAPTPKVTPPAPPQPPADEPPAAIGRSRAVERTLQRALERARAGRTKATRSPRRAKRFTDRWRSSDTVTPLAAASRRVRLSGDEVELPDRVLFKLDDTAFAQGTESVLDEVGALLQASPEIELALIEGHTDASGPADYNQRLSEARASAVRQALVRHGVAPERLVAYGFGETRPAASNSRSAGRQRNRRVVIRLIEADHKALDDRQPAEWGQATVIACDGVVTWTDAEGEVEPQPLTVGDRLSEGTRIMVEGGAVSLRLPDLSVISALPHSALEINKLYADDEGITHYTALRLTRGRIRGESNPRALDESGTLVALPGGSLEIGAGRWAAGVVEGGAWIRLDRGEGHAAVGGDASLPLKAGERLRIGEAAAAPAPTIAPTMPRPEAIPAWPEDAGPLELEVATDAAFHHVRHRETAPTPTDLSTMWPAAIAAVGGGEVYWRVIPVAADGARGKPSPIYRRVDAAETPAPTPKPAPAPLSPDERARIADNNQRQDQPKGVSEE